jgi:transposase InsO family protein
LTGNRQRQTSELLYPLVADLREEHGVDKVCQSLSVSRSGFYSWADPTPSKRDEENARLEKEIEAIAKQYKQIYGSPRIHEELKDRGFACNHKRVERLMKKNGIRSKTVKKMKVVTTDSKHSLPVAANLLNREFNPAGPNQVWVSDITYIPTDEGWTYLAVVIDLWSRKVVGWEMGDNMEAGLVITALDRACVLRSRPEGVIFHSDRGSQYASHDFREYLEDNEFTQSMSRKGDCWDNACAESFFKTLKCEEVFHRKYRTREEARMSVFEYIEAFYNRQRKHSYLGYLSPDKFECCKKTKVA